MATNITSMLQFWKEFNLPQLQRNLDVNATDLAGRQDASDASRRKLVEQSKEFKKATPEDVRKSVAPLLRSFQSEVDSLSKRSKASEADFLNLYKKLIELPDPVHALEQAEQYQKRAQRLNDVETENQKLRETLAEYNKEFAEVKNQEVTIKSLREKVREYEKGKEDLAKQLTMEKSEELQKEFVEKEKNMQETQLLIATKLGEAEQMAATYKAALESSQSELFDLKSKYDEELAAKQAEIDLVMGDVDRMSQRAAMSEKEIEKLQENLSASSQVHKTKDPATVMEESMEALSRSSLEAELANKEKEIGQLIEDVKHLQGSMGKLRESSATAIVKLEDALAEKTDLCQELGRRIDERSDYDEIKRELEVMKSTEFSSFNSSENQSSSSKSKSLELLLMEKNRTQQSENTNLRAANAQLTGSPDRCATSTVSRDVYDELPLHRKERASSSSKRFRRASSTSQHSSFSPTGFDMTENKSFLDPVDTLSQLQIQNQRQLNALLNLKIWSSLKAAVASQNISSTPLLSSFMNFQPIPSPKPFYVNNFNDTVLRSSNSNEARKLSKSSAEAEAFTKYVSQHRGAMQSTSKSFDRSACADSFDSSDEEDNSAFVRNGRPYFANFESLRRPSDPSASFVSKQDRKVLESARFRSLSHAGESRTEDVDTDNLTCQVKSVLQAHNIGQRAFGQYILGLSQGSVSEILSKPKPWSKLTLKGKEPFYKMMEFLSSPESLNCMKTMQRRDRGEKILCGTRTQPVRSTVAKKLAALREEMRTEQGIGDQTRKISSHEIYATERKSSIARQEANSVSSDDRECTEEIMTAVASGHCSMPRMSEKINPNSTNGAAEPTTITTANVSLPSSIISRQPHASGNVNARSLLQSCIRDKEAQAKSECSGQSESEKILDNANLDCFHRNISGKEKKADDISVSESITIKSESSKLTALENYFAAVTEQLKLSGRDRVKAKSESVLIRQCNIDSDNRNYKQFVNSSQKDPFIPPPLSPAAEDSQSSARSNSTCSPTADQDNSYQPPFAEESSHFDSENSRSSPQGTNKSSRPEELLQAPVLFKELSHLEVNDRASESMTKASTTCASFSGMLSSGMTSTSVFDNHASYTELNPVTSGSLFTANRESHELASNSRGFANVESGQNGMSSMLPPLATSGLQQQFDNATCTYSTLTTTVTNNVQHRDSDYASDCNLLNLRSSPIPPDALQKLAASHIDTDLLTKQVRDRLIRHGICQRIFGEKILGLSQGTVSDILSHPKPWSKLTHKGREPFARMILWLADNTAGGLLPSHEGSVTLDADNASRSSSNSPSSYPVNLCKVQGSGQPISSVNIMGQYTNLSSPSSAAHSPQSSKSQECVSPIGNMQSMSIPTGNESPPLPETALGHRHYKTPPTPESSGQNLPVTPLQQMLNIQELAANCPKLDTFQVTKMVKQLLTEHNIGQRIFGQAVLGLTQGSVSDLLSRPKLWRSLSLKGREPFVRMQLWLSDPNNIEQLKNLKMERWMEKKYIGKRQRCDGGPHTLSTAKKQRIVLSTEEKEVLRRAYNIEPYPSQETVDLLAKKLARKSSTIVNWFHNYRSRVKRGFFPGEQARDAAAAASNNKKHGGSKVTVKQLLEGISLPGSHSSNSCGDQTHSGSANFQRSFSYKNGHGNTLGSSGSSRRSGNRDSRQVSSSSSWGRSDNDQSPTEFDHCMQGGSIKTESLDQHFQNIQTALSDDMYPSSMMHVKEESKMMQLHSSNDMFCQSYSYPPSSTLMDAFKSHESSLSDPVAVAAASSYIQPKVIHETAHYSPGPDQLFTNLDNQHAHHHDDYANGLPNKSSFTPVTTSNVASSPSSPQPSSILPPVYTLTPKKTTYAQSNLGLPAASSLLTPSLTAMNTMSMENTMNLPNSHMINHPHRFVNLNRPRYDMVLAGNNNMNNNSHAELMKNTSFRDNIPIDVSSPMSSTSDNMNQNEVNPWVPVSATSQAHNHKDINTSKPIKSEARQLVTMNEAMFSSDADKDGGADDGYAWVF